MADGSAWESFYQGATNESKITADVDTADTTTDTLVVNSSALLPFLTASKLVYTDASKYLQSYTALDSGSYALLYSVAGLPLPVTSTPTAGYWLTGAGVSAPPTWSAPGTLSLGSDTNVTLSISAGTGTAALLTNATITAAWSGQLAVTRGGTGKGVWLSHCIPYVASGDFYEIDGNIPGVLCTVGGAIPTFRALVDGDLPVVSMSKGGTGKSSWTSSRLVWVNGSGAMEEIDVDANLRLYDTGGGVYKLGLATSPNISGTYIGSAMLLTGVAESANVQVNSQTANCATYFNGSKRLTSVTLNTTATKKYLQQVSSGAPTFEQVAFADLSGSATVAQGGTGKTSFGNYKIVATDGTGAITEIAAGAAGTVLVSSGASAVPAFDAVPATAGVTSLTGTANEVTVSAATGAVTVSLPDDVTIGTLTTSKTAGTSAETTVISATGTASDTGGGSAILYGVKASATSTETSATVQKPVALYGYARRNLTQNSAAGEIIGVRGEAYSESKGTSNIPQGYGVYGSYEHKVSSGSITNATGHSGYFTKPVITGGSFTKAAAVFAASVDVASAPTSEVLADGVMKCATAKVTGLTATRLVSTDASSNLSSVAAPGVADRSYVLGGDLAWALGGYVLLEEKRLGSAAATFDTATFPSWVVSVMVVFQGRGTTGAVSVNNWMRCGTASTFDSGGTQYTYSHSGGSGDFSGIFIGTIPANTASASFSGSFCLVFPDVATTSGFYRSCSGVTGFARAASTGGANYFSGNWKNTADKVARLQFFPGADNYATGSSWRVYGAP